MKIPYVLFTVAALVLTTVPTRGWSAGPAKEKPAAKKETKALHVCPMCPEVKHEGPGSCPKCGMDLVKAEEKK